MNQSNEQILLKFLKYKFKYKEIQTLTMLLQQVSTFEPTKFAYFPNSQHPCVQIHPSLQYIVFSTRAHQLILFNKKTGRTSVLYKSQHGILDVKFTSDLILAIEKGYHQILCFSLKTEKLKKKITGSRSQNLKLSYCRQRGLFCAITNDTCAIYNQFTLSRQKLLKCSTSSFIDCLFSPNGQSLYTVFKDSTFFVWDLDSYKYQQYQCQGKQLSIAANYSNFVCLYNQHHILVADLNKEFAFQKIEKFWDSSVKTVDFIENVMIIQTSSTFYIAQLFNQHRFLLRNVKAVEGSVTTFRVGSYGSIILLLSNGSKKISCLQIVDQNKKVLGTPSNPLRNQGLQCCGGYSNSNGCTVSDQIQMTQINGIDTVNPQALISGTYKSQSTQLFSVEGFQQFLSKHHIFPDKHRATAYKFLLQLPINLEQFSKIQRKGLHDCVEFMEKKYPLENKKLALIMKNIISWLAHTDPIFAEMQNLCQIVFPFICLFGQDEYLCFQIVYRVMTHWMSFLFEEFPVPNSKFLQNVYEILEESDPELLMFLKQRNIPFTKLSWGMLSTLFTSNLPKQAFLALIDNLVVHPKQPHFIMFILLGYLSYNRSRILSMKSQQDLDTFLQQQHTVSTSKFMKHVYKSFEQFQSKVTYKFQVFSFEEKQYFAMQHYPKDAVVMYRNRRKLLAEQHRKEDQEELYKQKLTKEVEKITLQAKRNSQRQMIMAESFSYHAESESKSRYSSMDKENKQKLRMEKIRRLQRLIDQLTNVLKNQQQTKNAIKQSSSFSANTTNLFDQSDRQLKELECKLMKKLTALKPNILKKPMMTVPVAGFMSGNSMSADKTNNFRAMMNAEMTGKMWEIDSLDNQAFEKQWENEMLRSMKA